MSILLSVCTMLILGEPHVGVPAGTAYIDVIVWPEHREGLWSRFFLKGGPYELRWHCTCGLDYYMVWRSVDASLRRLQGPDGDWNLTPEPILCD